MSLAESRHAVWALFTIAFIESSFFPIPPDVLMIPMILAAPNRAFYIAAIATVGSVLGGLFGYYIGYALFETLGQPILEFYGKMDYFAEFKTRYNELGVLAVLTAGVTPFPFKVITITSGVTALPLVPFVLSAIAARALRFFIVAFLLWKFGTPIRDFIEKHLGLVFSIFCILLIGGFFMVRFL